MCEYIHPKRFKPHKPKTSITMIFFSTIECLKTDFSVIDNNKVSMAFELFFGFFFENEHIWFNSKRENYHGDNVVFHYFHELWKNSIRIAQGILTNTENKRIVIHKMSSNCVITNKRSCPLVLITIWARVCEFYLIWLLLIDPIKMYNYAYNVQNTISMAVYALLLFSV